MQDATREPLLDWIERLPSDPAARDRAHRALLRLLGSAESGESTAVEPSPAPRCEPWATKARPAFLYTMYAIILSTIPIGIIAAVSPATAQAVASAMNAYLAGLPEPLYALFGTGYLGYATLRQWGKAKGTDR